MKIKAISILLLAILFNTAANAFNGNDPWLLKTTKTLSFPSLPYATDALEPYIDKMTMEIHHDKHHKAYYDNFLKALPGTEAEGMTLGEIFKNTGKFSPAIRNNAGGFYNHLLYFENMAPAGSTTPGADLKAAIEKKFGSIDEFKKQFSEAGKTRFGSGWAWLNVDDKGALFISSTANQDNPLMDVAEKKGTPILALDVWEHAYYLKYQNRRVDYIEAFWNVINWKVVGERFAATQSH
ncbi:MAG: superoxide dismutase [Bacteroidota bacterium]